MEDKSNRTTQVQTNGRKQGGEDSGKHNTTRNKETRKGVVKQEKRETLGRKTHGGGNGCESAEAPLDHFHHVFPTRNP